MRRIGVAEFSVLVIVAELGYAFGMYWAQHTLC